jgi:hypothetical protein
VMVAEPCGTPLSEAGLCSHAPRVANAAPSESPGRYWLTWLWMVSFVRSMALRPCLDHAEGQLGVMRYVAAYITRTLPPETAEAIRCITGGRPTAIPEDPRDLPPAANSLP